MLGLLGGLAGMGLGMASADEKQRMLRQGGKGRDRDINFLTNRLREMAQGKNSVREEQLRQSINQIGQQGFAQARAARPGQQAGAMRAAIQNAGLAQSSAAGQGLLARLMEQQQALQNYGNLATTLRGQDIGLATTQAQTPNAMDNLMGGLMGLGKLGF